MSFPAGLAQTLLAPFSALYRATMILRNWSFDYEWRSSYAVHAPVISIGNLTAGGTGKTPLTALLIEDLTRRGLRVGVVSRGYGGTEKGPARVPAQSANEGEKALRFGDEPSWFATKYPEIPVFIGADRVRAAEALLNSAQVDLILADDAFQHRRLKRDLDIVVLDASEPRWHYSSLPGGRMRESFASLNRAQAVFITKTNLATEEAIAYLRAKIPSQLLVCEFASVLGGFSRLEKFYEDVPAKEPSSFRGQKIFLASGIGRPQAFRRLMESEAGTEVVGHRIFPDHHVYTSDDLRSLEAAARAAGASAIVVTEKDAVKLQDWRSGLPTWSSRLMVRAVRGSLKEFYEMAHRTLR